MDPATLAWVAEVLGAPLTVIATRRGEEADLWHVRAGATDAWTKRHRHAAKTRREHAMYGRLHPALADAVPACLAFDGARTLLLSALPGRTSARPSASVYRQAGAFLRRLGELPVDDDPLPLPDAYARRFAAWLARAEPHVPATLCRAAAERFDPAVFAGVRRRLCHRDFRPANWRLHGDPPRLRVLDFGQARPDDPLVDLVRLELPDDPTDDPRGRALLEGIDDPFGSSEHARLHALRLLHALATATWAKTHGDRSRHTAAVAELRAILSR